MRVHDVSYIAVVNLRPVDLIVHQIKIIESEGLMIKIYLETSIKVCKSFCFSLKTDRFSWNI